MTGLTGLIAVVVLAAIVLVAIVMVARFIRGLLRMTDEEIRREFDRAGVPTRDKYKR